MRHVSTILSALAILTACGADGTSKHHGSDASYDPSTDEEIDPGPEAEPGPSCDRQVDAERRWAVSEYHYGIWGGVFDFDPDGSTLVGTHTMYELGLVMFDVATGEAVERVEDPFFAVSRDEGWTAELRLGSGVGYAVVDPRTGEALLDLATVFTPTERDLVDTATARVSADGSTAVFLSCDAGALTIHALDLAEGDLAVIDDLDLACAYIDPIAVRPALSTDGAVLFVDFAQDGVLYRIDLETGDHQQVRTGDAPLLDLALSPRDEVLVTTSADGVLRSWDADELSLVGPSIPVGVADVNDRAYAPPAWFSPVVWSPDGELLATVDPSGAAVVRRSCDGAVLATLPAVSTLDAHSGSLWPWALAFSRDGGAVGVSFAGQIAVFDLVDTTAP